MQQCKDDADSQIAAINRVADALFQLAKAERANLKLVARQVACSEGMFEVQKANMAVTAQLEAALTIQAAGKAGHA